ncbi:MAG TPA: ABC transporter permease [Blastocatellia bacterium]|nr:ABC transporter permease [Blastocatellia bacterium]
MRLKHWFYTVPLRLRSLFRRAQVEEELDEEFSYHLERQIEENIAKGMNAEEARYAALRAMGGVERRKEECRDTRRVRLIEDLMQDLRYGLRTLCKSPGFTTVAVLSLALGIGANTAIFSVVDPLLIKSLPVKDPEQLVVLNTVDQRGDFRDRFSYPLYEQLRARTQIFSGLFAESWFSRRVEMIGDEPGSERENLKLKLVSGEYFQVLGVNAILGRTLTTADNQTPGAHPMAVLSYRFWQRKFAGDVSVLGKGIALDGQEFAIVGVTAPEFFGDEMGNEPDIWAPLMMNGVWDQDLSGLRNARDDWLHIVARLRPEASKAQAQAALDLFLSQIKSEPSDLGRQAWASRILLSPGSRGFSGRAGWLHDPLRVIMAVVGLVLLMACANIANLLLARTAKRAPEVAIRLTLGAGRLRLIRQFLTESALLAAAGVVLGLLFARWSRRVILALISEYDSSISIGSIVVIQNVRVLGFTIAVTLLTTLLFGLAPALIATRMDVNIALKAPSPPRSRLTLSRSLLIAQVALSLLLLTGAGLFVQTLGNLRARDIGFDTERLIQGRIFPTEAGYKEDQLPELYGRIIERLNSVPGIRSATMADAGLMIGITDGSCCIAIEGYTYHPDEERRIRTNGVRSGYFQILGLPMLLGRDFTPQEMRSEPEKFGNVAIINETMARQYFGTANPLGKRFGWDDPRIGKGYPQWLPRFERGNPRQFEIIGVAKDAVHSRLRNETLPLIYFPSNGGEALIARVAGPAASLSATIRREILAVDKNLVIESLNTVPQLLDGQLFLERLLAKISSFFAMLALLLSCVGLYGLMSYDVARRTHEIGIRMALGAQRRNVVGMVLRETMLLVAIGVIIGLGAALSATRWITSLLYGLTPNDPLTIALAGLLLLTVALLAGYLPARRASRVDPMVALRHD